MPQSSQSVPSSHRPNSLPGPPSSQYPSLIGLPPMSHVFEQAMLGGGRSVLTEALFALSHAEYQYE